jgi:small subunit ribosomal protein S2
MHWVTERWLGGTLTNFQTVRSRLARLEQLEKLEETGELQNYSKKMISTLTRERKKIKRNLEGLRKMGRIPAAMVVFDVRHEHIAVKEARKMGVPTVCLLDTDGDPDFADIAIPGNDDSMRAVDIVARELAASIKEGVAARPEGFVPLPDMAPEEKSSDRERGGRDRGGRGGRGGDRGGRGGDNPRRRPPQGGGRGGDRGASAPAAAPAPAVDAAPAAGGEAQA